MKFEAEIIKDIVDSRGHTKTSIHYQSECVEEWVKEVEGAYPKLCDYQPEWLNYSAENKVGVFPYATLTDVTNATVENVVPYAYKRAILKGNTLINVHINKKNKYLIPTIKTFDIQTNKSVKATINDAMTGNLYTLVYLEDYSMFKPNTKYLALFDDLGTNDYVSQISIKSFVGGGYIADKTTSQKLARGKILFTTREDLSDVVNQQGFILETGNKSYNNGDIIHIENIRVFEYQDGMENWDIPYFEGMQSVKLPVLKTVGKNLTDLEKVEKTVTLRNNYDLNYIVKNGETVRLSFTGSTDASDSRVQLALSPTKTQNLVGEIADKLLNQTIETRISNTCSITNNTGQDLHSFFRVVVQNANYKFENIQLEQGMMTTPTTYEPFKSITLSTPSDLVLGGIGDVKDTLNLMTGEVVQRTKEIVLDENSIIINIADLGNTVRFQINIIDNLPVPSSIPLCDKFIGDANFTKDSEHIYCSSKGFVLFLDKTKVTSISTLKTWLQSNHVKVRYLLAEPLIKTVDLSIVDQDGKSLERIKPLEGTMHLNTSGETIKPLFSGEIPVEAITQNLASFIEE